MGTGEKGHDSESPSENNADQEVYCKVKDIARESPEVQCRREKSHSSMSQSEKETEK